MDGRSKTTVHMVLSYREALNQAMREEMRRDSRIFLIGEEVGYYQGAFKVSKGFVEEFGPQRVVDTPITEAGFTGLAIGAAMAGLHPIVELMTMNFGILALDQIVNNAAKIHYMSGGQLSVPLVIRGPGSAAHQLGAQHSQSLEAWFCHVPGLKVIAPATPHDAKGLLKSAIRDNNPVIFIEAQLLYGTKGDVGDGEYTIPIGVAEVKRAGTRCDDRRLFEDAPAGAGGSRSTQSRGHRGRGHRSPHPQTVGPPDDRGLGQKDRASRDRRRRLAFLRAGRADCRERVCGSVRLPGRPHPARHRRGCADAL